MTNPAAETVKQVEIENIAIDILKLETLEDRKMDHLDFSELAVWRVKAALEAAYDAGRRAGK